MCVCVCVDISNFLPATLLSTVGQQLTEQKEETLRAVEHYEQVSEVVHVIGRVQQIRGPAEAEVEDEQHQRPSLSPHVVVARLTLQRARTAAGGGVLIAQSRQLSVATTNVANDDQEED